MISMGKPWAFARLVSISSNFLFSHEYPNLSVATNWHQITKFAIDHGYKWTDKRMEGPTNRR